MDVDIARITKREPGMNAVEVMTSESQERMLAIVTPDDLDEVLALCARWEVRATIIVRVTDTARFRVYTQDRQNVVIFDGSTQTTGRIVNGTSVEFPAGDSSLASAFAGTAIAIATAAARAAAATRSCWP